MPPLPFDVTISLNAAHLAGTPHQGRPGEAVKAVRAEVEAIPGASWVSVDWCGTLPAGVWPLIECLEVDENRVAGGNELGRLQAAVEDSVEAALQTIPQPVEPPTPIKLPAVIRAALVQIPDRVPPDLPEDIRDARRLERRAKLREIEERRRGSSSF